MESWLKRNAFFVVIAVVLLVQNLLEYDVFSDPLGALKHWGLTMLYLIPGIIIGITVHEFAHAFVAYKLGDLRPKYDKRVSLNPIRHIDPIGLVALLFVGFGWGKPVGVNPYAFPWNKQRLYNLFVDIAGVITNFIFAWIFMLILSIYLKSAPLSIFTPSGEIVYSMLSYAVSINLVLMIFNLIPVPPLDGFGIVTEVFGLRGKPVYEQIYAMGTPILIALIVFKIPSKIISPAVNWLYEMMWGVCF